MIDNQTRLGIIGGTGMLGRAIAEGVLASGHPPSRLWVSNRSGDASGLPDGVTATKDNQLLADSCDLVLLSVPPAAADSINIYAPDRLVVSVMAGVSLERLAALTGARRVIRAMSSPAAARGLAYSPWISASPLDVTDRSRITRLFEACGVTDEVYEEAHIEHFTALTGPVPGFVAYLAECMADHATAHGIPEDVADRATRQLFLAAGTMLAADAPSPAEHVQEMIDYAGTTAAGLVVMRDGPLRDAISAGLDAAIARTRTIG
ncbi:pyrroline-5-carboxylate reductase family protein [Halovulum sp. GXIMD14794]